MHNAHQRLISFSTQPKNDEEKQKEEKKNNAMTGMKKK